MTWTRGWCFPATRGSGRGSSSGASWWSRSARASARTGSLARPGLVRHARALSTSTVRGVREAGTPPASGGRHRYGQHAPQGEDKGMLERSAFAQPFFDDLLSVFAAGVRRAACHERHPGGDRRDPAGPQGPEPNGTPGRWQGDAWLDGYIRRYGIPLRSRGLSCVKRIAPAVSFHHSRHRSRLPIVLVALLSLLVSTPESPYRLQRTTGRC